MTSLQSSPSSLGYVAADKAVQSDLETYMHVNGFAYMFMCRNYGGK